MYFKKNYDTGILVFHTMKPFTLHTSKQRIIYHSVTDIIGFYKFL